MIKWSGTFYRLNAPVDDTMVVSSYSNPGNTLGSLPVAIIILLADID